MPVDTTEIKAWFKKRLPEDWYALVEGFDSEVELLVDRDEIVVIGPIQDAAASSDADEDAVESARRAAVKAWRESTREKRMEIASEAQERFERHVSWGASVGGDRFLFTHISVPSMTRLRITERQVLDTLVDAGVASSRSEALAWCVRYAGKKEEQWLNDLKSAFKSVSEVRAKGPAA